MKALTNNPVAVAGIAIAAVIAIALVLVMALRPASESGTTSSEVKQMHSPSRARHQHSQP